MQICDTCRHWLQFDTSKTPALKDERWGQCSAKHELVLVAGHPLGQCSDLDTRSDFGCVAHEPRD